METLKRSLKIGVGLAAVVAVVLLALPERPTLLAGAVSTPPSSSAPRGTVELAQADTSSGPSAGQRHLERLRERNAGSRPAEPAGAPPTAAPSAPPPSAPAAAPAAPAAPPTPAPAPQPPASPSAGGGQGLDSLTRPSAPPQFRLIRSAQALDSGTIRDGIETIRLAGVEPLGADERCADDSACGAEARQALGEWLAGQEVVCAVAPEAPAPCVRGEEDVAQWVVANGWASAEAGSVYEEAEAQARDAGLGIWGSGGR